MDLKKFEERVPNWEKWVGMSGELHTRKFFDGLRDGFRNCLDCKYTT